MKLLAFRSVRRLREGCCLRAFIGRFLTGQGYRCCPEPTLRAFIPATNSANDFQFFRHALSGERQIVDSSDPALMAACPPTAVGDGVLRKTVCTADQLVGCAASVQFRELSD